MIEQQALQRHRIARVVALTYWALAPLLALAQQPEAPLPVQVTFNFGNFQVAGSNASISSASASTAAKVAGALTDEFKFWRFSEQPIADAPALTFVLDQRGFDNVWLNVTFKIGAIAAGNWDVEVLPAGYTSSSGFPKLTEWPTKIEETVKRGLIQARRQQLFEAFRAAPVGRAIALLPSAPGTRPKAVLPLPWDAYKDFSTSQFVLRGRLGGAAADVGGVQILSEGRDVSVPFSPDNPRYPGMVVELIHWKAGGDEADAKDRLNQINNLVFLEFFLLRQKRPSEIE